MERFKYFWHQVSNVILNNRITLLVSIVLGTLCMGFYASKVQLSYEMAKILPADHPDFRLYEDFKKRFGEDGNVVVLGVESPKIYSLLLYQQWYDLDRNIRGIAGIKEVLSNTDFYTIFRNDLLKRFDFKQMPAIRPTTQAMVDSIKNTFENLPFYAGFLFNENHKAHVMAVTFNQQQLNSKDRLRIIGELKRFTQQFTQKTGVSVHLSGMPYIRTQVSQTVSKELEMFLLLAVAVTAIILFLFFRNFVVVGFSLMVVLSGVVWSVGLMALLGFKVTLLSGLIPPLIIVIGVPNTIFLLNKYHEEFANTHQKERSLGVAIEKIGHTTLLTNLTTSIGFGVFAFTGSNLLVEFGTVASISILITYVLSLVLIPVIFSYLTPPSAKHIQHLEAKRVNSVMRLIEKLVNTRRTWIYAIAAVLCVISTVGMLRIKAIGYVVDDLTPDNPIIQDLKFFERNFKGVMPFEVMIDARQAGRILSPQTFTKIRRVEKDFAKHPEFTKPISVNRFLMFVNQAYRGGDAKYFQMPTALELNRLSEFDGTVRGKENKFATFLDSTKRFTRISFQMADVGTVRTQELINTLQARIDTIFNFNAEINQMVAEAEHYDARITGNSVVFAKGNEYLLKNLRESTLLAIFLICIIMGMLFMNARMVLIATLPSVIPLLITAGIMGFYGISLKPSTILIFSIAFGLSSDQTLYFLTRYKDEFRSKGISIPAAINHTILKTGISMFYTAVILLCGFLMFTVSTFKGTQALGILISITLVISLVSNLVLLPALLLTLNQRLERK